jgi:penicillin amidase
LHLIVYKLKTLRKPKYAAISKAVAALLDNSPPFVGSNSWVIAPQKNKKR